MGTKRCSWLCGVLGIGFFAALSPAEQPSYQIDVAALAERTSEQQMLKLPVRVVNTAGEPVSKAKVTPWALRSSQGHGWWREGDQRAGIGPEDYFTDKDGIAAVLYPRFRDVEEQIRTTSVSLYVDHPDYVNGGRKA